MPNASSISAVAMPRHWLTMPAMSTGRPPDVAASLRLTTSVASPAPSAAMIDAMIGCAWAGTCGRIWLRTSMIFCLPARLGAIELATCAWT